MWDHSTKTHAHTYRHILWNTKLFWTHFTWTLSLGALIRNVDSYLYESNMQAYNNKQSIKGSLPYMQILYILSFFSLKIYAYIKHTHTCICTYILIRIRLGSLIFVVFRSLFAVQFELETRNFLIIIKRQNHKLE